jgi:hypothetical protein
MTLLAEVIESHGGADLWRQLRRFSAHMSIGGVLLADKGKADTLEDIVIDGSTRDQFLRFASRRIHRNRHSISTSRASSGAWSIAPSRPAAQGSLNTRGRMRSSPESSFRPNALRSESHRMDGSSPICLP